MSPTLDKEDLDAILKHTSPHSFKHNVLRICDIQGLAVRTDPCSDIDPDKLVEKAITLAQRAVETRIAAAAYGIPLEEIQEVVAGLIINTGKLDPDLLKAAVRAVLFGLDVPKPPKPRARHPYENIVD